LSSRHTHPEVLAKRLRAIRALLQASTVNLDHVDRHGSIEQHVSAVAALLEAATMLEAVISVHPKEERLAWDRFYAASLTAKDRDPVTLQVTAEDAADRAIASRRERFGGGPLETESDKKEAAE
jgi:lactam utilization protein B